MGVDLFIANIQSWAHKEFQTYKLISSVNLSKQQAEEEEHQNKETLLYHLWSIEIFKLVISLSLPCSQPLKIWHRHNFAVLLFQYSIVRIAEHELLIVQMGRHLMAKKRNVGRPGSYVSKFQTFTPTRSYKLPCRQISNSIWLWYICDLLIARLLCSLNCGSSILEVGLDKHMEM